MRHFLTLADFSKQEILEILDIAKSLKKDLKAGKYSNLLERKTLGMIFEKNSTRTRVSFETGIYQFFKPKSISSNMQVINLLTTQLYPHQQELLCS